jgi:chromosome segregation ATPase
VPQSLEWGDDEPPNLLDQLAQIEAEHEELQAQMGIRKAKIQALEQQLYAMFERIYSLEGKGATVLNGNLPKTDRGK